MIVFTLAVKKTPSNGKKGTMQDQREPDLSVIGCMARLHIALAVSDK